MIITLHKLFQVGKNLLEDDNDSMLYSDALKKKYDGESITSGLAVNQEGNRSMLVFIFTACLAEIERQSAELKVLTDQVWRELVNQLSYAHVTIGTDSPLTHAHATVATDTLPSQNHVAVAPDPLLSQIHVARLAAETHVAVATDTLLLPCLIHVTVATDPLLCHNHVAVVTDFLTPPSPAMIMTGLQPPDDHASRATESRPSDDHDTATTDPRLPPNQASAATDTRWPPDLASAETDPHTPHDQASAVVNPWKEDPCYPFGLCLAKPEGCRPNHQALALEPHLQAWIKRVAPGPTLHIPCSRHGSGDDSMAAPRSCSGGDDESAALSCSCPWPPYAPSSVATGPYDHASRVTNYRQSDDHSTAATDPWPPHDHVLEGFHLEPSPASVWFLLRLWVPLKDDRPMGTLVLGVLADLLTCSARSLTLGGLDGHQADWGCRVCDITVPFVPVLPHCWFVTTVRTRTPTRRRECTHSSTRVNSNLQAHSVTFLSSCFMS
ncbi:uncharacterized protein LOC133500361 [Syngnathoides biaculeatus]|uniref:uncharacterized protein LOC133500361 n=1 Tax=Syngnathoides biaculeatus TaxID=300417 RepID=UPI002ADE39B2|nr:uncharacterized protein LOC133500361 [Syngnathoides biaculeatus]